MKAKRAEPPATRANDGTERPFEYTICRDKRHIYGSRYAGLLEVLPIMPAMSGRVVAAGGFLFRDERAAGAVASAYSLDGLGRDAPNRFANVGHLQDIFLPVDRELAKRVLIAHGIKR